MPFYFNGEVIGQPVEVVTNYNELTNKPLINSVTLAGNKSSIDLSLLPLYETMPEASEDFEGVIALYTGDTDDDYTNGYFYKCIQISVYSTDVEFDSANVNCANEDFLEFLKEQSPEAFTTVVSGTMTYAADADMWAFVGKNAGDETVISYQQYQVDWEEAGFTFEGTFEDGTVVNFTNTTETSSIYFWNNIDVQPVLVSSVNGKDGEVTLDAEDIEATVGSTEDTVQNHLSSLRNDLGDIGDEVLAIKKNVSVWDGSLTPLVNNTIYNAGEVASASVSLPVELDVTYNSRVLFTAAADIAWTAPEGVKYIGDHVTEGAFVPQEGYRYIVDFEYDGVEFVAKVIAI